MEGCWSNGLLEQRYSRIESRSNIDASGRAVTAAISPERLRRPGAAAISHSNSGSWQGSGYSAPREATATSSRPLVNVDQPNQLLPSPIMSSGPDSLMHRHVHASAPRPAPLFRPMLGSLSHDALQTESLRSSSSPLQSHARQQLQPRLQLEPRDGSETPGRGVGDTHSLALEDLGTVARAAEAHTGSQLGRRRQSGSLTQTGLDTDSGARALYNDHSNRNFV